MDNIFERDNIFETLEQQCKYHAISCHKMILHKYDDIYDYEYHLKMVRDIGDFFIEYIPDKYRDVVFAAIWEHDTLEDCGMICSFMDLRRINYHVSLIVEAVSTGKGTRKERLSDDYYKSIKKEEFATFVKLCDRIANVRQSGFINKKPIFDMYKKEYEHFKEMLYVPDEYEKMWSLLDYLMSE